MGAGKWNQEGCPRASSRLATAAGRTSRRLPLTAEMEVGGLVLLLTPSWERGRQRRGPGSDPPPRLPLALPLRAATTAPYLYHPASPSRGCLHRGPAGTRSVYIYNKCFLNSHLMVGSAFGESGVNEPMSTHQGRPILRGTQGGASLSCPQTADGNRATQQRPPNPTLTLQLPVRFPCLGFSPGQAASGPGRVRAWLCLPGPPRKAPGENLSM